MALVKYGAPVDEVAGSIGGITFQRNAAGHIARIRAKPIVRHSTERARMTALLSSYSWAWYNVLDAAQRTAWDTVAALTTWVNTLGQNYSPTGMAAYLRAAIVSGYLTITAASDPPTTLDEVDPAITIDYNAPGQIRASGWGTLASPPDGSIMFWGSGLVRRTVNSWGGPWPDYRQRWISGLPAAPWLIFNIPVVHDDSMFFLAYRIQRTVNPGAPPPNYIGQTGFRYVIPVTVPAAP